MEENNKGLFKKAAWLSSLGIAMVVATMLGFAFGFYIDGVFSTKPLFTILFTILGVIAGFKNIYTTIKKYGF